MVVTCIQDTKATLQLECNGQKRYHAREKYKCANVLLCLNVFAPIIWLFCELAQLSSLELSDIDLFLLHLTCDRRRPVCSQLCVSYSNISPLLQNFTSWIEPFLFLLILCRNESYFLLLNWNSIYPFIQHVNLLPWALWIFQVERLIFHLFHECSHIVMWMHNMTWWECYCKWQKSHYKYFLIALLFVVFTPMDLMTLFNDPIKMNIPPLSYFFHKSPSTPGSFSHRNLNVVEQGKSLSKKFLWEPENSAQCSSFPPSLGSPEAKKSAALFGAWLPPGHVNVPSLPLSFNPIQTWLWSS